MLREPRRVAARCCCHWRPRGQNLSELVSRPPLELPTWTWSELELHELSNWRTKRERAHDEVLRATNGPAKGAMKGATKDATSRELAGNDRSLVPREQDVTRTRRATSLPRHELATSSPQARHDLATSSPSST